MAWSAASSNPVGAQHSAVLSELRAALAERNDVAGSPATLPPALTTGQQVAASWYSTFQAAVTTLIPEFVDYSSAVAGSLAGQATIDNWTESSILADLGASRLSAPATGYQIGTWAGQQYDIIDRLRWSRSSTPSYSNRIARGGEGATWAAAVSAFDGNTWAATAPSQIAHGADFESLTYRIYRFAADIGGIVTGATYDLQLYGLMGNWSRQDPNGDFGTPYENADFPTPEDTFALLDSGTFSVTGWSLPEIGKIDAVTVSEVPASEITGYAGYKAFSLVAVAKHDVPGGFTYVS